MKSVAPHRWTLEQRTKHGRSSPSLCPIAPATTSPFMEPVKRGLYGIQVPDNYHVRWRDFWSISYLVDYLFVILVGASSAPFWKSALPIKQWFSVQDPSISFPMQSSTIPDYAVITLVFVPIPLLLMIGQVFFRNLHDLHHSLLGLLQAIALCALYHAFIWFSLGQMRPNFLAMCQPIADGECSVSDDHLVNARHDFPSGHAAFLFCVIFYYALYVWAKGESFRTAGSFATQAILFSLLLVAFSVGATRVANQVHSSWAVLAGFLIGGTFAFITYHLHYPPFWQAKAGIPRLRIWNLSDLFTNHQLVSTRFCDVSS